MPRIPGLLERIQQPLYDRNTVATSGTTNLNYFQVPLGGGSTPKTQVSTNMDQGGSLPYPKNFEIHAIRLVNQHGAALADLNAIYNNSWFRLFIGTKDYLVVNTFMLTAGVGVGHGEATAITGDTNAVSVVNGMTDQRGIYVLAEPIDLIPQQNFRCEVNFPTAQTLTATVGVSIYLDGFFKREVH